MQTLGHTYSINGKCTTMPLNTLLLEKIGIDCPTVDKKYVSKMQLFAFEFSRALAFGIIKLQVCSRYNNSHLYINLVST